MDNFPSFSLAQATTLEADWENSFDPDWLNSTDIQEDLKFAAKDQRWNGSGCLQFYVKDVRQGMSTYSQLSSEGHDTDRWLGSQWHEGPIHPGMLLE